MALAIRTHDQSQNLEQQALRDEALRGFAASPKAMSPKFFYDHRGSQLFELICQQPEYYPTRTEETILRLAADAIAELAGRNASLVELGSGASRKIRLLLEALRPARYLGIDISREFLDICTRRLAADYRWLDVHALCADFSQPLKLPAEALGQRPLAFFPGSSIGNFDPIEARAFLRNLHQALPAGSGLLIGVDLVKDRQVLERAYNDAAGVTALFNLNLLERIRTELDSDIDPQRFAHRAFYNEQASRIEMHLVSREKQQVRIEDRVFDFAAGETLHTENSYKYTPGTFRALAGECGFASVAMWRDPAQLFSVHFLRRE
ncbi:L-histidine N(alpha)-methyltransferase [Pseudomonas sp. sia0905]|uniref:L-histidine N(alpha)-methyltransferase n=1 Tax=Pseudomonas sp. sia0905 TaxID=2854783 RepID=UPI001C49001C|nr:L-histidine N(alpha)-methyltransferase [Pseudomonas sp. sia0905]MBV7561442.1 L-histidine N(alpha)-methyltransferase [Pseudomonas sp. sia0905]